MNPANTITATAPCGHLIAEGIESAISWAVTGWEKRHPGQTATITPGITRRTKGFGRTLKTCADCD